MASHGHRYEIVPPKTFELPKNVTVTGAVLAAVGALFFAIGFLGFGPTVAWKGYVIGFWFTLSLGLFGPFFVATQHLSIAGWSVPIRRIPEAFGWYIPVAAVFALIGLFAIPDTIYLWKHPDALQDAIFAKKAGFLNQTGFILATVLSFLAWTASYMWMRSLSLRQDEEGGYAITNRLKAASCVYLVAFVVGLSFMSWYWLMSMEPNWFSTMFSVYAFAGLFQCGLALTYILMIVLGRQGVMGSFLGGRQVHDLGKMVFGFTTFYAYIAFCQFLLIWYANIPEEDVWYLQRLDNGWAGFTLALPFVKFIVPFLIMLPQKIKKNKDNVMLFVCMWLIGTQLFEVWYWVAPQAHGLSMTGAHGAGPSAGFNLFEAVIQIGISLGFIGLFILVAAKAFAARPTLPVKDPFLHESLPEFTHEAPLMSTPDAH